MDEEDSAHGIYVFNLQRNHDALLEHNGKQLDNSSNTPVILQKSWLTHAFQSHNVTSVYKGRVPPVDKQQINTEQNKHGNTLEPRPLRTKRTETSQYLVKIQQHKPQQKK
jgi:hypothetical protein